MSVASHQAWIAGMLIIIAGGSASLKDCNEVELEVFCLCRDKALRRASRGVWLGWSGAW